MLGTVQHMATHKSLLALTLKRIFGEGINFLGVRSLFSC